MSEIVFPSTKAGNEVDRAVTAALSTIPGQITQIDTRVTALEEDVDDLSGLPAQVTQIGSNLDELETTLNGGNIPLSVTWTNGFIYSGGASTNVNYQRTEINLLKGQTITFTGGKDSTLDVYALAKKVGTSYTKIQSYAQNAVQETIVYTAPEDMTIVISSGKTFTDGVVSEVVVGKIKETENKLESEVIYDVSANNDGATFDSLSALLSSESLSTLIPVAVRCGGMSIRFMTSDNKYVQYRLISTAWSTNVANWQGVDDEPTAGSDNLVKSGGVAKYTKRIGQPQSQSFSLGRNIYVYGYAIGFVKGHTYEIRVSADRAITGSQLLLKIYDNDNASDIQTLASNLLTGTPKSWDGTVKIFQFVCESDYENATIRCYCSNNLSDGVFSYNVYDITYDAINSKLEFIDSIDGELFKASTIYNGTPNNHSNTTKVRTSSISVNAGDTIIIVTDRPLSAEGNYYATYKYYKNSNGDVIQNVVVPSAEYMTQVIPDNAATTEIGLTEFTSGGDTVTLRTTDFTGYYIGYKVFSIKDEVKQNTNRIGALETLTTSQGNSIANNASGISKEKELNESSFYEISSSYDIAVNSSVYDTTHIRIVQEHIYEITVFSETAFSGTQLSLKVVDYTTNSGYNIKANLLSGTPKSWDGTEQTIRFVANSDIKDAKIGSYGSTDLVGAGGYINFNIKDLTIELLQNPEPKTDIFSLNPDVEYLPKIANLKRATAVDGMDIVPVSFLWFSDQHDNSTNNIKRINEWRNHYATYIDDVLNCGDSVATKWNNDFGAFLNNGGDKMLMVIGNHDVADPNVSDNYYNGEVSKTDVYNKFMGIMDDAILGVVRPSDAATAGKCYYYKDYSNIRLIVVDVSTEDNVWIEDESHSKTYYEAQCTWLTNVLNDAKTAGKSVIIASHFPSSINENQDAEGFSYYTTPSLPSAGRKIHEEFHNIVDTFISGGGEFITWLCGHVHSNRIGTVVNHANQQIICVTTSSYTVYRNTRINNVVRSAGNKSEDAFNMISFDTVNKLIKIVRIGLNYDGFYRKVDSVTLNYSTHAVIK